jgi:hypothetical protein
MIAGTQAQLPVRLPVAWLADMQWAAHDTGSGNPSGNCGVSNFRTRQNATER